MSTSQRQQKVSINSTSEEVLGPPPCQFCGQGPPVSINSTSEEVLGLILYLC